METLTHPNPSSHSSQADANRQDVIRRRAEEIYIRNGRIPGRDIENWIAAEAEILREAAGSFRRTAVAVKVGGVCYVGEYSADAADGYAPGEFAAGDPITVRFDGDKMFVRRSSGSELETRIVKKIS